MFGFNMTLEYFYNIREGLFKEGKKVTWEKRGSALCGYRLHNRQCTVWL